MTDATIPINYPAGFEQRKGMVLHKHMGTSVSFALWVTGSEQGSPTFRLTQCWKDGEETTGYFYFHELEAMTEAAREHMNSQMEGE